MEKRLIGAGLLAGAVGAVPAFVFARLCAEPVIARAIAFEDGRADAENAHGVHEHGAELFSRGVQSGPGLGFGVLIFGLAMGALFAVLFSVVYPRTESISPQALSLLLAAGAFGAVYLVPFVKYPPNPPAVGQADTIGARTGWYLALVAAPASRPPTAPLRDAAGAIVYPGFPADVLYEFRLVSLAAQLVLWAGIGLVFAAVSGRLLGARAPRVPA